MQKKISNYSFLHVKRMVPLLLRRVFKSGGRLNSNRDLLNFLKKRKKRLTKQKGCDIVWWSPFKSGWEHSSAGRASALQAEGHRFEPYCSHDLNGLVAQLVRALACHARGRGFEPHPGRLLFSS